MTPDPTLNAELGNLLGATPAREWRVEFPDGKWWSMDGGGPETARRVAQANGGVAVEKVTWPAYDSSRDLMAGVEEELERRGMTEEYGHALAALILGSHDEYGVLELRRDDAFYLAHAPPDLRARAARDVLKAGEKEAKR
jgi:hypothetical protein